MLFPPVGEAKLVPPGNTGKANFCSFSFPTPVFLVDQYRRYVMTSLPSACSLFHCFKVNFRHSSERWFPVYPDMRTGRTYLKNWSRSLVPPGSHVLYQMQTSSSSHVTSAQMHWVFNHFPNKSQFQDPSSQQNSSTKQICSSHSANFTFSPCLSSLWLCP